MNNFNRFKKQIKKSLPQNVIIICGARGKKAKKDHSKTWTKGKFLAKINQTKRKRKTVQCCFKFLKIQILFSIKSKNITIRNQHKFLFYFILFDLFTK